jgi:hypothetical protein
MITKRYQVLGLAGLTTVAVLAAGWTFVQPSNMRSLNLQLTVKTPAQDPLPNIPIAVKAPLSVTAPYKPLTLISDESGVASGQTGIGPTEHSLCIGPGGRISGLPRAQFLAGGVDKRLKELSGSYALKQWYRVNVPDTVTSLQVNYPVETSVAVRGRVLVPSEIGRREGDVSIEGYWEEGAYDPETSKGKFLIHGPKSRAAMLDVTWGSRSKLVPIAASESPIDVGDIVFDVTADTASVKLTLVGRPADPVAKRHDPGTDACFLNADGTFCYSFTVKSETVRNFTGIDPNRLVGDTEDDSQTIQKMKPGVYYVLPQIWGTQEGHVLIEQAVRSGMLPSDLQLVKITVPASGELVSDVDFWGAVDAYVAVARRLAGIDPAPNP